MKTRQISLKWKIFRYLMIFCGILLIVLWLLQTVFLDSFYKAIKTREIKKDAATVLENINNQDIGQLLQTISDKGNLYVEFWMPRGSMVFRTGEYPEAAEALSVEERASLFDEAVAQGGQLTRYYSSDLRNQRGDLQESILYAQVMDEEVHSMLILSTHLLPVDSTVQTLRVQLFVVSGIMIVLAVGLALLMARRLSKPIEEINRDAIRLGQGDYNVDFHGEGYREISQLSKTLTQASHELSKTELLRQELIANVSHDLRTPLTLISGYGEMLRDFPEEATPENVQIIVDEAKRLSVLVEDLLDLSKLQAGITPMQMDIFSLTDLVKDIIGRYAKFNEHEGYSITFLNDGEVEVNGDAARIAQVVYNLIGNAISYTGEDKKVTVAQRVQGDRVWISVTDTGKGMPPEVSEKVWERYYREDTPQGKTIAGSGLGLSIVKTILDQHPGVQYGVESILGQGSTFWFSLPVEKPITNIEG
ncbi:MAG: sensor histidine kinase [Oscillospiraceae bacterium]